MMEGQAMGDRDSRTRWDARYAEIRDNSQQQDASTSRDPQGPRNRRLTGLDQLLVSAARDGAIPTSGNALDIAGGSGSDALYMASIGLDTTLLDISGVGLEMAKEAAADRALSLNTIRMDIEAQPLPDGPWDVIHIAHYLHRPTIRAAAGLLKPGGVFLAAIATMTNLERHPRPPAPFLLERGELVRLVGDLTVEMFVEDWQQNGVHEAWLVARRSVPDDGA